MKRTTSRPPRLIARAMSVLVGRVLAHTKCAVVRRSALTLAFALIFAARGMAATEAWEYSPYRVHIWMTPGPSAEVDDRVLDQLSASLATDIQSYIGAPWRTEIERAPAELEAAILYDHKFITGEVLEAKAPDVIKKDKLILLTLETTLREYIVVAREFDCRTRMYGSGVRRVVRQRAYLSHACFQAISDCFRAMTRLEEGAPKAAKVRVRAGGLVMEESSPCYVGIDDVLLPILRTNDRSGVLKTSEAIEWTYLIIQDRTDLSPYLMDCRVWSGKPNPVQGRVSSRKERYAIKVRPTGTTSVLRVEARVKKDETPYPMAGLEVYSKMPIEEPPKKEEPPKAAQAAPGEEAGEGEVASPEEAPAAATEGEGETETPAEPPAAKPEPNPNPPQLVGVTDWRGMITVEPGKMKMRILYLKNGGQLLARLPVIPGLEGEVVAQVPDDGPRLQAEGFKKGLEGQLMDVEAQRQILHHRFKMRIEEGNIIEAEALYKEFQELPTRQDLQQQLLVQRNKELDPEPGRVVRARIDGLYNNLAEALGEYLSTQLANEMLQELNRAKAASR